MMMVRMMMMPLCCSALLWRQGKILSLASASLWLSGRCRTHARPQLCFEYSDDTVVSLRTLMKRTPTSASTDSALSRSTTACVAWVVVVVVVVMMMMADSSHTLASGRLAMV